jgi:hypothetical protein
MAHKVNTILETADKDDKFLVICENSHMGFGFGVPERIWAKNKHLVDQTFMIYT